ncbi:hypothetical protein MUK42_34332 [Musa troglodytarum]|uniref:Uncharacterized protein n=1 Tax=Musa troglodytarum TaxID=320322 RepID=A0A9E7L3V0_9LILI|nr:hypothetical protein MUK42_34332 [Musa troglodytarum]
MHLYVRKIIYAIKLMKISRKKQVDVYWTPSRSIAAARGKEEHERKKARARQKVNPSYKPKEKKIASGLNDKPD